MKPVLFLGASGKLGRAMQRFWQVSPSETVAATWVLRGQERANDGPFDAVVALWGVTSGTEQELAMNSALAQRAVRIARDVGAQRVLHLSSAAVYSETDALMAEGDATEPTRPYGQAKCHMEAQLAALPTPPVSCALRLANVAGADSLFKGLSGDGEISIDQFENGAGPLRSYIAVPELAAVIEALVTCDVAAMPKVLNVAAPEPVDMGDIARAAGRSFAWIPAREGAVARHVLDTQRLQGLVTLPDNASDARHLVDSWRRYGGWT
ncbi:NAD-dependent epimerase/dehydratase family protein [Lentibacter algarum]|uniref:NAD-dependent epimerase/dehydratase family protein n=1 Tax=Lentibacter algarum TaxID=576131 RepID=UPI001C06E624|nr:NAD-dependent epimerase/dehydratase family protein [Lentibacter algarum]MBU2981365.1 NAD-dependent epimerase/dehydratase family protein [Lentibacter algarum]